MLGTSTQMTTTQAPEKCCHYQRCPGTCQQNVTNGATLLLSKAFVNVLHILMNNSQVDVPTVIIFDAERQQTDPTTNQSSTNNNQQIY